MQITFLPGLLFIPRTPGNADGIIDAIPYVLPSIIAFLFCLAVPRLRHYAFPALVAPIAFGFCAFAGTSIVLASIDKLFNWLNADSEWMWNPTFFFILYFSFGVVGAWLAVAAVNRFRNRADSRTKTL